MITVLNKANPLVGGILKELRSIETQNNRELFRRNLEKLGFICGYEASKWLDTMVESIQTPLGKADETIIDEQPVIATILRAGIPFYQGVMQVFPNASSAFFGAARVETGISENPEVELSYSAIPKIKNKTLIIADPMLATGNSVIKVLKKLYEIDETPSKIIILSVVAAPKGLSEIQNHFKNLRFIIAAQDSHLNANAFIVPGLGDAGDLAFGKKNETLE